MILQRYLLGEILRPAAFGFVLLVGVYGLFTLSDVLSEAVAGRVAGETIASLVFLRTLIATEVLLPTALFLAIVWAFVRLDRDSELAVLRASGQSLGQLFYPTLLVALMGAALVAALTLQVRPWAYRTSYTLEEKLIASDPRSLEPGRFYQLSSRLVLLADGVTADGELQRVFAEERRQNDVQVIRAESLVVIPDREGESRILEFREGTAYLLRGAGRGDSEQRFSVLRYPAVLPPGRQVNNQRRARSVGALALSDQSKDIAELQWRLSLPLTTALMGMVAAAISIGRPRAPLFPRLLLAVGAYILVFNVAAVARTWVENAVVPSVPGLWWSLLVPASIFAATWYLRRV